MPQPRDKSFVDVQANPYFADPRGYPFSSSAAFAAAVAALPDRGGEIQLGPGTFYLSEPWVINKPCIVRGRGCAIQADKGGTRVIFQGHTAIVAAARILFEDFAVIHSENTNTGLPTNTLPASLPCRQWRPSRSVRVGTHLVGVECPWRWTEIQALRPWHHGISFACVEANGSRVTGAEGTTGTTEPVWPFENPKIGAGDVFAFTVNTGTDVISATGSAYSTGQRVRVYSPDGTLPAPLTANTTYFVRDPSGATFKVAATSGGTAIDLTTAGSGTLQIFKQAFNTDEIADGNVRWKPVLVHGVEVQSICHFRNMDFQFMPGNAINVNCSTLYAPVPNTIDPRLGIDNCNASLGSVEKCHIFNVGGHGIYLLGYDSSVWYTVNNDIHDIHGMGIYDNSAFGGIHVANHFDGCEEGYSWAITGTWLGNYNEATFPTFGAPVVKSSAMWIGGAFNKMSGIATPRHTTLARNTAYALDATVKLPVDNGRIYICTKAGTTHATVQPAYRTGSSWFLSYIEQGINKEDDTYPITVDGTAEFRVWGSSEISNGWIDRPTASYDRAFVNRYQGYQFWAAGESGTPSAYSFAADTAYDNNGTKYDMILDSSSNRWRWQRGGSIDMMMIGAHGSASDLPAGAIGFPNGFRVGGTAQYLRVIYGTAAPTTGTWIRGERVLNADASAGGIEGWVCVTGGTPGTWKTFGSIAA